MVVPLIVLAIGAVLAGFLGVPEGLSGGKIGNYFEHFLKPAVAAVETSSEPAAGTSEHLLNQEGDELTEITLTVISSVVAIAGIGLGLWWFRRRPLWKPPEILEQKYYVDEAYDAAIIQPIKHASTGVLWKIVDVHIIDGAVNGAAHLARIFATGLRFIQSGLARSYVAVLVLGALLLIGYFVIR